MYRIISCAAAASLALCVAGSLASADDIATCDKARGGDSIAACGRVLKLNPRDAAAYTNRGLAYLRNREHDKAIADFDLAIRLDPSHAWVYRYRGYARLDKGEYDSDPRLQPSDQA